MQEPYYLLDSQGYWIGIKLLTAQEAKTQNATRLPPTGKQLNKNTCPQFIEDKWTDSSSYEAKKIYAKYHHMSLLFSA